MNLVANFREGDQRATSSVQFREGDAPAVVAYRLCDLAKQVLALERSDTPPEPRMKDPPPPPENTYRRKLRELMDHAKSTRPPEPLRRKDEP